MLLEQRVATKSEKSRHSSHPESPIKPHLWMSTANILSNKALLVGLLFQHYWGLSIALKIPPWESHPILFPLSFVSPLYSCLCYYLSLDTSSSWKLSSYCQLLVASCPWCMFTLWTKSIHLQDHFMPLWFICRTCSSSVWGLCLTMAQIGSSQ